MTKTGWRHITFDLTLEGEPVRWEDLDEASQEYIAERIKEGYTNGEICIETDEEDEQPSALEQAAAHYGWPLKIRARGYTAHLIGIQPMNEGKPEPIYRFPGGDSLVDLCELVPAEEETT